MSKIIRFNSYRKNNSNDFSFPSHLKTLEQKLKFLSKITENYLNPFQGTLAVEEDEESQILKISNGLKNLIDECKEKGL